MTSQIRRACNSAIFGMNPFFCARRELRLHTDTPVSFSDPYSPIARLPSQDLSVSGHRDFFSGSGGLFPQLLSGSLAEVPSDAGQDNPGRNSNVCPCFIRIGSSKIAVRFSAVTTQVQSPLSKFVLRAVGFLVAAHVFNHMSGVSQRAGKDNQDRGYFSQAKNGRNSNVRR